MTLSTARTTNIFPNKENLNDHDLSEDSEYHL